MAINLGYDDEYDPYAGPPRRRRRVLSDYGEYMPEEQETPDLPPMEPEQGPEPMPARRPRVALDRLGQFEQTRPEVPKQKLWQKIAAGAVGGLAGYINTGDQARVDPRGAISAIKYGDYPERLENWEARRKSLETLANIEEDEQRNERDIALSDARIRASRAAEEASRATAARAAQPPPPPPPPQRPQFDEATYNRAIQAGLSQRDAIQLAYGRGLGSEPSPDQPKQTREQKTAENTKLANDLGLKEGSYERLYVIANGAMPGRPPRTPPDVPPPKPPRTGTPAQFIGVKNRKEAALLRAEADAGRQISVITGGNARPTAVDRQSLGADANGRIDQIYRDLEITKQRIQQKYEEEIQMFGGSIAPPVAPPAPAAPKPPGSQPYNPPPAAASGDGTPPPEILAKAKVGDIMTSPTGKKWRKKPDGTAEPIQ